MTTTSIMSDRYPVAFAGNGEHFVSGGTKGVQVWRVEDSQPIATMAVEHVQCVAFSKDSKWIAAGTYWGNVIVWDAKVYRQTFTTWKIDDVIRGVDFSPNSTRLVALGDHTAIVWDIATSERVVGPLQCREALSAKYSADGERIATATQKSIRIYNSNDGRERANIPVRVTTRRYNTGFLWSNDHLFVISDQKIKQVDSSTKAVVSEWSVPDSNCCSCIALPRHGEFIASSANRTVTLWETSTHAQLGLVRHSQDIYSIALSPDGRFLVIGGEDDKITIKRLSGIVEPDIQVVYDALGLQKHDQLKNAEQSLTAAISTSRNMRCHVLAGRALIRTRLGQWNDAIADAENSIKMYPSIIGYIAKSIAHVSKGEKHKAYRACDIAFQHCHPSHTSFLLLIKAIVVCMAGEHVDAILRVDELIASLHLNSVCYMVQVYMHLVLGDSHMKGGHYEDAIQSFKRALTQLRPQHASRTLSVISVITGWEFDELEITIRKHLCVAFYAAGRTHEAGESLLRMVNTVDEEVYMRPFITMWVSNFLQQYLRTPSTEAARDNNMSRIYAPILLLKEWTKLKLTRGSWEDALVVAGDFIASRFTVYQTICEQLNSLDRITDAVKCFQRMLSELRARTSQHTEQAKWVARFRQYLLQKLEDLGEEAMLANGYDEAISKYSAALSLDPSSPHDLFVKRSKAYVAKGLLEDAKEDAKKAIALDSSSPWGYERKYAALHEAGEYDDAIAAFETMLKKISQSPDPKVLEHREDYVNPAQTKAKIRKIVGDVIRNSPRVLIRTKTGQLLDRQNQVSLFESETIYKKLVSSMTMRIDDARIQREVAQYFRYAILSHTWEDNEPEFEDVIRITVYDLGESFTHKKLKKFCEIAREAGLDWAWSDTCCINKSDRFIHQEALVAMFKWYAGSAVTIIFLRGIHSPSQHGDIIRSLWNTRAWTLQEYHASKVVRFYTENWSPYLNLDIPNHKDSPEIISEMEKATGVSAQSLVALRPGLEDIRVKLCLASKREMTYVEDAAYSLLGIFSANMPISYGEGDQALGRLLAQLLTSSGDASILAWTGESGSFNSCLPASIAVFSDFPPSHIPQAVTDSEREPITFRMRPPSPSFSLVVKLYDRLHELPLPSFGDRRMKLPCLTFKLGPLSATRHGSRHVYRARTDALGIVKIETTEDLSRLDSLTLVHPWIDFLLRRRVDKATEIISVNTDHQSSSISSYSSSPSSSSSSTQTVRQTRTSRIISLIGRSLSGGDSESLQRPLRVSPTDRQAKVLEFIARLRKPFGALLFTPTHTDVPVYKRVASESLITVQVAELTTTVLNNLIAGARVLYVL